MTDSDFSPAAAAALRAAGWHPGRAVPTDGWAGLSREGFTPFPLAFALLAEFGGLTVEPVLVEDRVFAPSPIRFDPFYSSGEFDRVEGPQEQLGQPLFPLGEVLSGWHFLVAPDGSCYAVSEFGFTRLATTFPDAIELLLFARKQPTVLDG